jgi:hypothetical protein
MSINALATRLLIGCLTLCVTSCFPFPYLLYGNGNKKAEAGIKAAAPVIIALQKFHDDHGHYPAHLDELAPVYLLKLGKVSEGHLVYRPGGTAHIEYKEDSDLADYGHVSFRYLSVGDAYTLTFGYSDPAPNWWVYDSKTKTWMHGGGVL